jgi:hypothetical protein
MGTMPLRLPLVLIALSVLFACASGARPPVLDWSATRVQVHVDNVAADQIAVFEDARRRWLAKLHDSGRHLPDGRPLFFSGKRGHVQTYLTFYPFTTWADLDRRAAATKRSEATVGKAAVDDYDSGDAALVPPHHSEIWLRLPNADYAAPSAPSLNPRDARRILLEAREMPVGAGAEAAKALWDDVRQRLSQARYPLNGRAYWNLFGSGQLVLLWLGPDAEQVDSAPRIEDLLRTQTGGADVASRLEASYPVRLRLTLERRDDLSNLAPR